MQRLYFVEFHNLLKVMTSLHVSWSCRGMVDLPCLEAIYLSGNPLATAFHYRVMAACVCGRTLRTIDGMHVTKTEKDLARALGPQVIDDMDVSARTYMRVHICMCVCALICGCNAGHQRKLRHQDRQRRLTLVLAL